jgi:hypothetical protein|tara:strand:- start:14 stop:460 length:447 start_codon:yes stop_codon:yes gene_type:complete
MGSLIPDSDKNAIGNVFDDIHDTFSRDIVVFQRENEIFVATNGTYNALYSRIKNEQSTRSKVTRSIIKARILYQQEQKEMDLPGTRSQVNVQMGEGSVRVKIDEAGYVLFTKASKIEIDGEIFRIVSDPSKVGPFKVKFYTIYLRRSD